MIKAFVLLCLVTFATSYVYDDVHEELQKNEISYRQPLVHYFLRGQDLMDGKEYGVIPPYENTVDELQEHDDTMEELDHVGPSAVSSSPAPEDFSSDDIIKCFGMFSIDSNGNLLGVPKICSPNYGIKDLNDFEVVSSNEDSIEDSGSQEPALVSTTNGDITGDVGHPEFFVEPHTTDENDVVQFGTTETIKILPSNISPEIFSTSDGNIEDETNIETMKYPKPAAVSSSSGDRVIAMESSESSEISSSNEEIGDSMLSPEQFELYIRNNHGYRLYQAFLEDNTFVNPSSIVNNGRLLEDTFADSSSIENFGGIKSSEHVDSIDDIEYRNGHWYRVSQTREDNTFADSSSIENFGDTKSSGHVYSIDDIDTIQDEASLELMTVEKPQKPAGTSSSTADSIISTESSESSEISSPNEEIGNTMQSPESSELIVYDYTGRPHTLLYNHGVYRFADLSSIEEVDSIDGSSEILTMSHGTIQEEPENLIPEKLLKSGEISSSIADSIISMESSESSEVSSLNEDAILSPEQSGLYMNNPQILPEDYTFANPSSNENLVNMKPFGLPSDVVDKLPLPPMPITEQIIVPLSDEESTESVGSSESFADLSTNEDKLERVISSEDSGFHASNAIDITGDIKPKQLFEASSSEENNEGASPAELFESTLPGDINELDLAMIRRMYPEYFMSVPIDFYDDIYDYDALPPLPH